MLNVYFLGFGGLEASLERGRLISYQNEARFHMRGACDCLLCGITRRSEHILLASLISSLSEVMYRVYAQQRTINRSRTLVDMLVHEDMIHSTKWYVC